MEVTFSQLKQVSKDFRFHWDTNTSLPAIYFCWTYQSNQSSPWLGQLFILSHLTVLVSLFSTELKLKSREIWNSIKVMVLFNWSPVFIYDFRKGSLLCFTQITILMQNWALAYSLHASKILKSCNQYSHWRDWADHEVWRGPQSFQPAITTQFFSWEN